MNAALRQLILALFFTAPLYADDSIDAETPASADPVIDKEADISGATGNKKPDIRKPGPDTANYPNSAYTLPQGGFYAEITPFAYTGDYARNPEQYNASYLFRYGLFDWVELRLFSTGLSFKGGNTPETGFSPLVFDTKLHFWDELKEYYLPAAGFEAWLQTTWLGSPSFNQGTQPAFTFTFDQTLPGDVAIEYNIGAQRFQDPQNLDVSVWDFAFQWAIQRDIIEDLAFFVNGYYNASTLPRFSTNVKKYQLVCDNNNNCVRKSVNALGIVGGNRDIPNVVGAGLLWTLNDNLALYCNIGAGTDRASPPLQAYLGFAWTP